jgi:hypothetical protein
MTALMLLDQLRTALGIATRAPRARFDQEFDAAGV